MNSLNNLSIEDFNKISEDEALSYLGKLIDKSFKNRLIDDTKYAIKLGEEYLKRDLTNKNLVLAHYFLGNAWNDLLILTEKSDQYQFGINHEILENEIIQYRLALKLNTENKLEEYRLCQLLTNLGNSFLHIGRYVEAIEYWDKVLEKMPIIEAISNKGICLYYYSYAINSKKQKAEFLKYGYSYINKVLNSKDISFLPREFINNLKDRKVWTESVLKHNYLEKELMDSIYIGGEDLETKYRNWCLRNRLFLNPLNDLYVQPFVAEDTLLLPPIVVSVKIRPSFPFFFNQIKQEYVSARYLFYEGKYLKGQHFSDKKVLLYNTLDYPSYSYSTEKIKAAFRINYSILDKIAYFLNKYLELSIPERYIYFRSFWFIKQQKSKGFRNEILDRNYWPLKGLYWLSKDLYEDNDDFKEAIDPDAQEIAEIRNYIEHKYFKVCEIPTMNGISNNINPNTVFKDIIKSLEDSWTYSLTRKEFELKTLKLIKITRSALMYLALFIELEENERHKKYGDEKIFPLYLDMYDDEWKL